MVVFDHKVRHAPSNWHSMGKNNASKRGPLHRVHLDQSPAGALTELTRRLPEDAEELQKRRFQIINVSAAWLSSACVLCPLNHAIRSGDR